LILRKIIKIVATRCQILRLKCTKLFVGWSSAPDPAGRAYSAPQTPYLDFRLPTPKKGKGRGGKERGRERRRREGGSERRGRKGTPCSPVTPPATTFGIKACRKCCMLS